VEVFRCPTAIEVKVTSDKTFDLTLVATVSGSLVDVKGCPEAMDNVNRTTSRRN
jgi:hypothetical protein